MFALLKIENSEEINISGLTPVQDVNKSKQSNASKKLLSTADTLRLHDFLFYRIHHHWTICIHIWQIQEKKLQSNFYCHGCNVSSAYKSLSEAELRRCYIILSTSLLISHWGKLCVGVFEIICERFLKCYHHLGNGWHCPEKKYFKGFQSWTKENVFSVVFYFFLEVYVSISQDI